METNVTHWLEDNGIAYTLKPHQRPVFTSEQAALERGVRLAQIVKTMLLKTPENLCVVALIPGDRQLDLKKLRAVLNTHKLAFIPRESVYEITGYEPGAVAPIGMKHAYPTCFDEAILEEEFVAMSAGRPDAGIILRSLDLFHTLKATRVAISKPPAEE